MDKLLIPLGICVVLPVMIVWLVNRTRQNETNRKTEIMLKAIEAGATIDANFFKAQNEQKTIKERLLKRLAGGCIFSLMGIAMFLVGLLNRNIIDITTTSCDSITMPMIFGAISVAIGLALLIVFFVGRKMLAKEMEAEAKSIEQK